MNSLNAYSIPLSGLKDGMHQFDYQIDSDFFKQFPETPIAKGVFKVHIDFDKKPTMIDVLIDFQGTMSTPCDRCLVDMQLPIAGQERLLVKYSDDSKEDTEVVYIPFETADLNIAKYIYEFVCLAIPLIKTHDLSKDTTCDEKMLDYLDAAEEKESKTQENPIWDQLKDIKLN